MDSLGFSVQAEHAHQIQGRCIFCIRWNKELLSITHTAGVTFTISHRRLFQKAYQCNNSLKWYNIPASYMTYLKYQIGEILTFVGQNANSLAK